MSKTSCPFEYSEYIIYLDQTLRTYGILAMPIYTFNIQGHRQLKRINRVAMCRHCRLKHTCDDMTVCILCVQEV